MDLNLLISLISVLITVFSIGVSYGSLKNKIDEIPKMLAYYAKKDYVEKSLSKLDDKNELRIRDLEAKVLKHETIMNIKGCRHDAELIERRKA